jgi:hypothetical protein
MQPGAPDRTIRPMDSTSYAVTWREPGELFVGKLEPRTTHLAFEGASGAGELVVRLLPYREISDWRIERAPPGNDGRQLVLTRRDGTRVAIASVAGVGALAELAQRLVAA